MKFCIKRKYLNKLKMLSKVNKLEVKAGIVYGVSNLPLKDEVIRNSKLVVDLRLRKENDLIVVSPSYIRAQFGTNEGTSFGLECNIEDFEVTFSQDMYEFLGILYKLVSKARNDEDFTVLISTNIDENVKKGKVHLTLNDEIQLFENFSLQWKEFEE